MEKVPSVSGSGRVSWFNEDSNKENRVSPFRRTMRKSSQARDPLYHKEGLHNNSQWWRSYEQAKDSSKNLAVVKEEDDENREEHWKPRTPTNFGCMEQQFTWRSPMSPLRMEYHEGLNKFQRKEYLQFNAKMLRTKYGVIQEEEEEYVVFEEKKIPQ